MSHLIAVGEPEVLTNQQCADHLPKAEGWLRSMRQWLADAVIWNDLGNKEMADQCVRVAADRLEIALLCKS